MNADKDKLLSQVRTLKSEFVALSKKKPNDQVNKFKLKYVNQTILASNEYLKKNKPYTDFEAFNEDELPSNSDVLMMLDLYFNSLCHA